MIAVGGSGASSRTAAARGRVVEVEARAGPQSLGRRADGLQGGEPARLADLEGRVLHARAELGDPPVPELDQVRERRVGAAGGVERHPRHALGLGLDDHDPLAARPPLGRLDGEVDEAVGGAGAQRLERRLQRPVERHVDQRDGVAGRPRGLLRAAHRQPEERVRDVGHDEPDGPRCAGAQRPRGDVRPVAELLRRAPHGLLGLGRDAPGGLARQHERHGRLRHAGGAGDVDARDTWVPGADARQCRSLGWTA